MKNKKLILTSIGNDDFGKLAFKFTEIWKVKLSPLNKVISESYEGAFVLMTNDEVINWRNSLNKKDVCTDYCVDLTGDLFYNTEFYISEVIEQYPVSSLNDVVEFCHKNNISQQSIEENLTSLGLFVGGEKQDLISNNLELVIDYRAYSEKVYRNY